MERNQMAGFFVRFSAGSIASNQHRKTDVKIFFIFFIQSVLLDSVNVIINLDRKNTDEKGLMDYEKKY